MNNKKGYTLVELIITLAIVGIMVVPIFNAFIDANRVNLRSRRQISAAYLAQNELERIKATPNVGFNLLFTDLANDPDVDITIIDESKSMQDDDWSATIERRNFSNGGTDFTVETVVTNITDEIGITVNSTLINNTNDVRESESTLRISNETNNLLLATNDAAESGLSTTKRDIFVKITRTNDSQCWIQLVDDNNHSLIDSKSINTDPSDTDEAIILNILGFDTVESDLMTQDWNFHIVNQSERTVDVKSYKDKKKHIKMLPDSNSNSNIYIGNSFPIATGAPSTVKEYYRVVITVSHNGTNYEVIESTVGK